MFDILQFWIADYKIKLDTIIKGHRMPLFDLALTLIAYYLVFTILIYLCLNLFIYIVFYGVRGVVKRLLDFQQTDRYVSINSRT